MVYLTKFDTPWGIGKLLWNDQGIVELRLIGDGTPAEYRQYQYIEKKSEPFDGVNQLRHYFSKKLSRFTLPLNYVGTEFDKIVWEGLRQIPYGERWTYSELAAFIGHPKAARAVGNANHRNPIPIIIPCHRVVRRDGSLGGYALGMQIKSDLLHLEAAFR